MSASINNINTKIIKILIIIFSGTITWSDEDSGRTAETVVIIDKIIMYQFLLVWYRVVCPIGDIDDADRDKYGDDNDDDDDDNDDDNDDDDNDDDDDGDKGARGTAKRAKQ